MLKKPKIADLALQFDLDPTTAERFLAEAERQGLIVMADAGAGAPGGASFDQLKQFTRRQLPASEAPAAFDDSLTAIGKTLELRDIPWDQAKPRPRIELLPEAALLLANAKDELPEMIVSPADPQRLRYLSASIVLKRAFFGHARSFARWVEADLADNEQEAATLVKEGYDPVRVAAKAKRSIGGALGAVETYLYGPARQAADNRATGARLEKRVEAKVGPAAHARGIEEGVKLATSRIEGALDEMFADGDKPAAPPTTGDRRGGDR